MNIKIILLSNKIDKFYKEAINEYEKRLQRYCKIELIQVKNKDDLLKKVTLKSYKLAIKTDGKLISSEELAQKINNMAISGNSDVVIVVGEVNLNIDYDEIISISKMKMEVGLIATILLEQIYRAYRIINNQPYHK